MLIAEMVASPPLIKLMRELSSLTCLIILLYDSPNVPACPNHEHTDIIAAMEEGNIEKAIALMIGHLDHIEATLDLSLPGTPKWTSKRYSVEPVSTPSALKLAARVRSGETRAVAIAERQLARIAALNPSLNALVQVDATDVRLQAALIDARCAAGEDLPLAGVPVTIKDNLWLQGQISTCGSWLYRNHRAPRDSWAVARLRQAGAPAGGREQLFGIRL